LFATDGSAHTKLTVVHEIDRTMRSGPVRRDGLRVDEQVVNKEERLRERIWTGLVCAGMLLGSSAGAQAPGQAAAGGTATSAVAKSFDVASVRPTSLDMAKMQAEVAAGKMPRVGPHVDGLRAEYIYLSLKDLICVAYHVKPSQISGPDWLGGQRFDVVAKMPEGSTADDAPEMLRGLLEERFHLKTHRETQERPIYALVVAKGGPKLQVSTTQPKPLDLSAPLTSGQMKMDGLDGPMVITRNSDGSTTMDMGAKGKMTQRMDGQSLHLDSSMITMDGFAQMLTNFMTLGAIGGRAVVNQTGLTGAYEIKIEISLADLMAAARGAGMNIGPAPAGGGAAAPEASDPGGGGSSVFRSVDALGLKLEARKAQVEQLVVDSADKIPTEN
jgi:uncharacterized protein (TIGR03435 family)